MGLKWRGKSFLRNTSFFVFVDIFVKKVFWEQKNVFWRNFSGTCVNWKNWCNGRLLGANTRYLRTSVRLWSVRENPWGRSYSNDEKKRDEIINHLYKNDIYPGVHYVDNTLYPMYSSHNGTCPNAHKYSKQLITLPIHLEITKQDCIKVIKTIEEIL